MALSSFFGPLRGIDIGEIRDLLIDAWPRLYGATGCPAFSLEYLSWLYGGPEADRNRVLTLRDPSGRLAGVKVLLFRQFLAADCKLHGYLATHLAIRDDLPMADRIHAAAELRQLRMLAADPGSLDLAFFETGKPIARSTRQAALKAGLALAEIGFQQFLVNRRRLFAQAVDPRITIQPMRREDTDDVIALRLSASAGALLWQPDPGTLWHHLQVAPGAFAIVARDGETAVGVLGAYVLDWCRAGVHSQMLVCEWLAAATPAAMTALMHAAQEHADNLGLRGIVLENAAALNQSLLEAGGLLKSPRAMILAVRSAACLPEGTVSYLGDIK